MEGEDAGEQAGDKQQLDDVAAGSAKVGLGGVCRMVPGFSVALATMSLSPLALISTQLETV